MPAPSRDWIRLIAYLCLFALVAWWVLRDSSPPPTPFSLRQDATLSRFTQAHMKVLAEAIDSYRKTNGHLLAGDNAAIMKTLVTAGARHSAFLKAKMNQPNAAGAFLDPWFTPYRIQFSGTNSFSIQSAGPNGRFGDGDDLSFATRGPR